jgi:sec-independent protein translocase protein TatC
MEELSFLIVAEQVKRRLKESATIIAAGFILGFSVSNIIIKKISEQLIPEELMKAYYNPCLSTTQLISTSPAEVVMVRLQIALLIALALYLPFLASWVFRAIKQRFEIKITRKSLALWLGAAVVLFSFGFSLTYFVILPQAVKILTIMTAEAGIIPLFAINDFMFFAVTSLIIFSISFEFPLILTWLALRGLISQRVLKERRRYFYVAIVTIAAVITADPTPVSQLLLSGPLIFLYEVSVLLAGIIEKIR